MRKFLLYFLLVFSTIVLSVYGVQNSAQSQAGHRQIIVTDTQGMANFIELLVGSELTIIQSDLAQNEGGFSEHDTVAIFARPQDLEPTIPTLNLPAAMGISSTLPWLSPQRGLEAFQIMDQFLTRQTTAYTRRNYSRVTRELERLTKNYAESLQNCQESVLVTTLPDLESLSFTYNLAVLHLGTDNLDTAQNERYLRDNDLTYILYSPHSNNNDFRRFLTNRNYTPLAFETFESPSSTAYLQGLRSNLNQLVTALECSFEEERAS